MKEASMNRIPSDTLSLVYMPDIVKPGAFDEDVQGRTHIAYIASMLVIGASNVEQGFAHSCFSWHDWPAEVSLGYGDFAEHRGNKLACCYARSHVWAVCVGYTHSAKGQLPVTYEQAADLNFDSNAWSPTFQPFIAYVVSKRVAEKAAWHLHKEAKSTLWLD